LICGKPRVLSTFSGGINDRIEGLKNIIFPVIASRVRIWRESWFLVRRYRIPSLCSTPSRHPSP